MSSVALIIDGIEGLEEAARRIRDFGHPRLLDELLDGVGALVASQTQERIASEKRGADGVAWPAWSERTAARRHAGQSLLVREGHLRDSIHHVVAGNEVRVGSDMIYAAIHQFGGRAGRGHAVEIPARPYLGLSDDNRDEVRAVVEAFIAEVLA